MPTPAPLTPAERARVNDWFNSELAERIASLAERWRDEREYEDFAEYSAVLASLVPAGIEFEKATKAPFGFYARIGGGPRIWVGVKGKYVQWQRA